MAIAILALSCAAADWLNEGGDPHGTNWQRRERILTTANVKNLKLIWKLRVDNQSKGSRSLTPPVILGHWITNRGTKELLFVGGSGDNVYSVDADLGRLFWKRHFERAAAGNPLPPCDSGMTAAPAFAEGPPLPPGVSEDDEDDAPQSLRPLFVVSSDGRLHTMHPTTGLDISAPLKFLPPDVKASGLMADSGTVYAITQAGCGAAAGEWAITPGDTSAKPTFRPSAPVRNFARIQETRGAPWIYTATSGNITAYSPEATRRWSSRPLISPAAPVVANGIVYALSRGTPSTHAVLYALDAITGKELFSSREAVTSFVDSSALAVANGHVCFGTSDNTLYCFGFPVDM